MLRKHRITIRLNWASLNKDVQDKAYRMARLAKLGVKDTAEADKLESEITLTEEDMALLKRAMTQGLAEVVTMCREYVWNKSHTSEDLIMSEDNVQLVLMMPVNFNLAGCASIGHAIHAYIVGKAMLEWFRYTVPARAAEQQAICDAARKEISTIINARVRAMRGGESLEVIVGESVTMLWACSAQPITAIPTADETFKTNRETITIAHAGASPTYVAVGLPQGYTPGIGGKAVVKLGNSTYEGAAYTWWTAKDGFTEECVVSYKDTRKAWRESLLEEIKSNKDKGYDFVYTKQETSMGFGGQTTNNTQGA